MEKRCYECMELVGEDNICPNCGLNYSEDNEKSLLKERYYLGKIFAKTLDSTVFIAFDTALGKKVFVREFTGESLAKISNKFTPPELRQKFLNYAKGTATLNMSGLLPHTVDAFAEQDAAYLVTDYFEGESLKTLLNAGVKISFSNAVKMAKQLLKRLETLHNTGFVFGAISPETLYVLKNGEMRVFGVASKFYDFLEDVEGRVEILNPSYAAPELFGANGSFGPSCDIYSVAAILYRILTSKIPAIGFLRHGGDNLIALRKLNKNIPKNLQNAILNALNWQGEKRTSTVGAFLDELSAKKVKRVLSWAILWANILGFFQKIYDKFAEKKEKEEKDQEKKRNLLWVWIVIPLLGFILLIVILYFAFPNLFGAGSTSSTDSVQSEDGWYYGDGRESFTSSNDYFFGGYSSEKGNSSNGENSSHEADSSTYDPNAVECPDLVGYTLEEAKLKIERAGLVLGVVTYKPSNDYVANYVMEQSLASGGMIQKGAIIDLIVCSGSTAVRLPDVSGISMNQAKENLENAGYTNLEYVFVASDEAPGTVISAEFEDLLNTDKSDKVIIRVSGERVGVVLDYSGKTVSEAKSLSPEIKFDLKGENGMDISGISDSELQTYTVVSQDVEANTPAYKGLTVTLTVRR